MAFKFDSSGMDKLNKNLNKLKGTNQVQITEVLGEELFLLMVKDFDIKEEEDFDKVSKSDLDEFISRNTEFSSYDELVGEYIFKQLTKGMR